MNKTKHALFLGLLLLGSIFITAVYAEESYRFELEPEYQMSEDDDDVETTLYGINGRFYFSPVNIGNHPYGEAAFLERVGNIAFFLGQGEVDFGGGLEADGPTYGAELVYMQPGSPIFIAADYTRSELSFDGPLDLESEGDGYSLQLGGFATEGLLLSIGYAHAEVDVTSFTIGIDETTEFDHYALIAKFVKELSGSTAFNLEGTAELIRFDDGIEDGSNTEITVAGDYYFTRALSLGAGFETNQGDDETEEGKTFLIRANAFITPKIGVKASFEQFSADGDAGVDDDTFHFAILVRI